MRRPARIRPSLLVVLIVQAACGPPADEADPTHTVIPLPRSIEVSASDTFHLEEGTRIVHDVDDEEARPRRRRYS